MFQVTSYLAIGASAAVGFMLAPSATVRWIIGILLSVMAVLQLFVPNARSPKWQVHLYLGVQCIIPAALMFVLPGWTMFPILYFPLSVTAVLYLPTRIGSCWIVVFTLITGLSFGITGVATDGLMALVIYGGVNAFFGAFANAMVRADNARRESQALLAELQEAHRQLQEYALRAEEMAVVQERNRLAREMHDTLGHRLTVASVQLEAAQRLCQQDQEKAASMVGTVREQVREALRELRGTVATLRTPIEVDLQLCSAILRLIGYFENATGLTVHRVLPAEIPDLPEPYRLALYRTAQEALTNTHKHAGARQVWLVLASSRSTVTLTIGDDGRGITRHAEQTGYGLQGLRERAVQLGGELHIEPRRGGGTELSLQLPLLPAAASPELSLEEGDNG